jgi:hypothetical protein
VVRESELELPSGAESSPNHDTAATLDPLEKVAHFFAQIVPIIPVTVWPVEIELLFVAPDHLEDKISLS